MPHKLLLADDSVTIQRVIELTFADEDIDVVSVSDGFRAIEAISRNTPDIVLADVSMPEKDGYAVASFVKGDPRSAHVPVVLLTGAFEPLDESRAETIGCDAVLVKPFEPQQVITKVKELLAKSLKFPSVDGPPERVAGSSDLVTDSESGTSNTQSPTSGPVPMQSAKISAAATGSFGSDMPHEEQTVGSSVLAQAFTTFLAVEQGSTASFRPIVTTASKPSNASLELTDEMLESLVDRVVERLNDSIIRETIADRVSQVAERLLRDEIDRIKAGAD